jgi:hypothetical protein
VANPANQIILDIVACEMPIRMYDHPRMFGLYVCAFLFLGVAKRTVPWLVIKLGIRNEFEDSTIPYCEFVIPRTESVVKSIQPRAKQLKTDRVHVFQLPVGEFRLVGRCAVGGQLS